MQLCAPTGERGVLQVLSNVDTILQSAGAYERVRRLLLLLAGPAGVCARVAQLRVALPSPPAHISWAKVGALWPRREFRFRMIIYERGGSRIPLELLKGVSNTRPEGEESGVRLRTIVSF